MIVFCVAVGRRSITVRVRSLTSASLQPWAKAGIIIKASTRPGSAYAAMMVTGHHGVRMQYDYTGDIAGPPGTVSAASPRWLRLTRSGDTITGYESIDGTRWRTVGTAHLPGRPATVQAGLFAATPGAAHSTSQSISGASAGSGIIVATGAFDHVVSASYTPANGYFPLAPWAGFAVLCGYAALALGLAVIRLRRRDA